MSSDDIALASAGFSALAAVVSVIALVATKRQHAAQLENEAHVSNVSSLVELWALLGQQPRLLRFHGISEEELAAHDLSATDLAYLVASFEAACHYYENLEDDGGIFPNASLRYEMCAPEATRKAWPLVRKFFAGSPKYVTRIEATMQHHARLHRAKA